MLPTFVAEERPGPTHHSGERTHPPSPATRRTTEPACCGGATPSPTASIPCAEHAPRRAVLIAFAKNPNQFIQLQNKLGSHDALNEYIQHIGSGIFAVQGGVARGGHWGDGLFT
jgi:hypothetical protein